MGRSGTLFETTIVISGLRSRRTKNPLAFLHPLLNGTTGLFIAQGDSNEGGIFYQRIARIYDSNSSNRGPIIYLIKPDRVRYWTRSSALRDADEVSVDIMLGHTELTTNLETLSLA